MAASLMLPGSVPPGVHLQTMPDGEVGPRRGAPGAARRQRHLAVSRSIPMQSSRTRATKAYCRATCASRCRFLRSTAPARRAIFPRAATSPGCGQGTVEGTIDANLPQIRSLAPVIPESVALGYHFCFGTTGGGFGRSSIREVPRLLEEHLQAIREA